MTEQDMQVPLSVDRILAAAIKTYGSINIKVENLLDDYSEYQLGVTQVDDDTVSFNLVSATVIDGEVFVDEDV